MLTNRMTDLEYTKLLNDYGMEKIEELFPRFRYNNEPIIPYNKQFNFTPIQKTKPDKIYKSENYKINTSINGNSSLGSNNWVINGNTPGGGVPDYAYLLNVTSPTGLKTFYDLTNINLAKTFWEKLKA